jgi:hypothetical protein
MRLSPAADTSLGVTDRPGHDDQFTVESHPSTAEQLR